MTDAKALSFGASQYLLGTDCPDGREQAFYDRFFDARCLASAEHGFGGGVQVKGGRGSAYFYTWSGKPLVLRHYCRGGLVGRLTYDKFFRWEAHSCRAFAEFLLLKEMHAKGLPVPTPFLARQRHYALYTRNDIVTQRITDAGNLAEIIAQRPLAREEWREVGAAVGRLFAAGVVHTDLNLRNVLLTADGRVYIIDFDKCFMIKKEVPFARRDKILKRLERSFAKEKTISACVYYESRDFEIMREEALVRS